MNFIIYNALGQILRTGSCPDEAFELQAGDDEFIMEGTADPMEDAVNTRALAVIPGGRVKPTAPPDPYTRVRARMYPPVEEQLDMLWHAMDQNVLPRVEPFYSLNQAVKQAVPKPAAADDVVVPIGRL